MLQYDDLMPIREFRSFFAQFTTQFDDLLLVTLRIVHQVSTVRSKLPSGPIFAVFVIDVKNSFKQNIDAIDPHKNSMRFGGRRELEV